jgi:uncharacterized protein YkuJ
MNFGSRDEETTSSTPYLRQREFEVNGEPCQQVSWMSSEHEVERLYRLRLCGERSKSVSQLSIFRVRMSVGFGVDR